MSIDVIKKAQELAQVIAQSPEFIGMRTAEDAASRDDTIAEAFGRYSDLQNQVERISMQKEPDFAQMEKLSEEMKTVQKEIQELPLAKAMQAARGEFTEMMNAVNAELSKVLSPDQGCSGDCSACGGHCH